MNRYSETKVPALIDNRYAMEEVLGKGAFAIVYKCVDIQSNKFYAAKVFQKTRMSKRDMRKLETEARICRKLNHPNIVRLHLVIVMEKIHIFLFDLVTGGELFDDLVTREGNYTEEIAAKCMYQILEAVKYCHKMGIIHRDLKPENILLESKEYKVIKLADFGLSVEVEGNKLRWHGVAGTPNYMAPEMLEMAPYGKLVDCWACGVILYILLSGHLPFYHTDPRRLDKVIKAGDYSMEGRVWDQVTPEGKDLVKNLLCVVPKYRLTASQAMKHAWFVKVRTASTPFPHCAEPFEALKEFNARRKMRAAINTAIFISKAQIILTAKKKGNLDNTETHSNVTHTTGTSRRPTTLTKPRK